MKKVLVIAGKNGIVYRVAFENDKFKASEVTKQIANHKGRFYKVMDNLYIDPSQVQSLEIHDIVEEVEKND